MEQKLGEDNVGHQLLKKMGKPMVYCVSDILPILAVCVCLSVCQSHYPKQDGKGLDWAPSNREFRNPLKVGRFVTSRTSTR